MHAKFALHARSWHLAISKKYLRLLHYILLLCGSGYLKAFIFMRDVYLLGSSKCSSNFLLSVVPNAYYSLSSSKQNPQVLFSKYSPGNNT